MEVELAPELPPDDEMRAGEGLDARRAHSARSAPFVDAGREPIAASGRSDAAFDLRDGH